MKSYIAKINDVDTEKELIIAKSHGYKEIVMVTEDVPSTEVNEEGETIDIVIKKQVEGTNPQSPSEFIAEHFPVWVAREYLKVLYTGAVSEAVKQTRETVTQAVDTELVSKITMEVTEE
jgi:hypothetical protein